MKCALLDLKHGKCFLPSHAGHAGDTRHKLTPAGVACTARLRSAAPRGWQGQALSLPAPPEPGHGSLGVQTQAGCDAGTYNTGSVSSALRPALELLKPWALPK